MTSEQCIDSPAGLLEPYAQGLEAEGQETLPDLPGKLLLSGSVSKIERLLLRKNSLVKLAGFCIACRQKVVQYR